MLLALADWDGAVDFAVELAAWIDRFGLDGTALEVDRGRLGRGDQYGAQGTKLSSAHGREERTLNPCPFSCPTIIGCAVPRRSKPWRYSFSRG